MSSRFSASPQPSRPPHICRKPPEGPEFVLPPLPSQPLPGYVEFFNPSSPFEGGTVGPITMRPTAVPYTWIGSHTAGIFSLHLDMEADVDRTHLDFKLTIFMGGYQKDTVDVLNHVPRSWNPFNSDQVTPLPQPYHGRIGWHIWT